MLSWEGTHSQAFVIEDKPEESGKIVCELCQRIVSVGASLGERGDVVNQLANPNYGLHDAFFSYRGSTTALSR